MAKSKKAAAQYESGTLAAFAVAGILLIALGVVSLLAVVGGLKGTLFSMVKRVMQGLGGGLCLGVSVILIWAGVLVAFSSGRSMPKRGFLLFTLLFFLCWVSSIWSAAWDRIRFPPTWSSITIRPRSPQRKRRDTGT